MAKNKYSVILPTYNERRNLPIVAWLLNRTFTAQYVHDIPSLTPSFRVTHFLVFLAYAIQRN